MSEHRFPSGYRRDNDLVAIEHQIASLGDSIGASRRHRDRLLRSASNSIERTRHKSRSAKLVVVLSFVLIAVSPLVSALARVKAPVPPTADRANAAALRHAEASRMSFDWALVDVFNQFRESKRANH